jgi:VWFA-related protein
VLTTNSTERRRTFWILRVSCLLVFGFVLFAGPPPAEAAKKKKEKKQERTEQLARLPVRWAVWLEEEVYPLITKEQRQAFLSLETDAQRNSFAERLWLLWGRQSGYGASFRQMYEDRLAIARSEFGNTIESRARVLLLHGPPTGIHDPRCPSVFTKMQFWIWSYIEGLGEDVVVLFYQRDAIDRWRMWNSMDGMNRLYNTFSVQSNIGVDGLQPRSMLDRPEYQCPNGDTTMKLIRAAAMWSEDSTYLRLMNHAQYLEGPKGESASNRFLEFSALIDDDALPLDINVENVSRGARGGLVEVGFDVDVGVEGLGATPVGDLEVVQLDVVGEIVNRSEVMVDRFRYLFSVPQAGDRVGLAVERLIRPGDYLLRLKIEDVHSKHASLVEHVFEVVALNFSKNALDEFVDPRVAAIRAELETPLEETEEEQPMLQLIGPQGDAVSGVNRFEAIVRDEVHKVAFYIDNEVILTKNRPPFDIDLDLGPLPRMTAVSVVGYDESGGEIARDGYTLNVGRERFFVSLKPVSPSAGGGGRVTLAAELNIPSDRELERLELFWNDEPLATLHEPPYEAAVILTGSSQFGYVRALATLTDDSQAEDIQFVNSPEFGTVVKVTAVELPVTVLDKQGEPVTDLTLDDFTVLENKVEQSISHFSLHRDLPVRMGIVIDTSGSMTETLPTVQRVVMGFLRDLLRPRDRAFIETFSERPDLLAGFTADLGIIENALLALYADRETALYDAIIMGLFQFSGITGRRAMVVLSDGEDTVSENSYDDALGYAQRMGVTIYTIGINIGTTKINTRWQFSRLASATGGKAFFVSERSQLDRIYDEINRELRTQYLLAYTSNSDAPADELRKIKVEVDRKGVKVRTLTGYYPAGG